MQIHHMGYAVQNISEAEKSFFALGYERESSVTEDEERKVKIRFLKNMQSGLRVELVEPMCDKSPATSWLKKNGNSSVPYHICYETEHIERKIDELKKEMWFPISALSQAPAIEGRRVVFMYSPNGGVIELLETDLGRDEGQ